MDGHVCTPEYRKEMGNYYFGKTRSLKDYEKYAGVRFKDRKIQKHTLDMLPLPCPVFDSEEKYEKSLIYMFKHCIDIHSSHFKEKDYDFWVVSFEMDDGTVINRRDANQEELESLLKQAKEGDGWVRIWRDFDGIKPDKYIVWPHSKSKDYVERLESKL